MISPVAIFVLLLMLYFSNPITCLTLSNSYLSPEAPDDYKSLVEYANILSLSYCVKHGLQKGRLSDSGTNCNKMICHEHPYQDIQVLSIFNFNDLGDVGAGFYGIDHTNGRVLVVFRGTNSRRDWVANIDTIPRTYTPLINLVSDKSIIECDGCKVHRGYYNFLQKNCAELLSAIKDLKQQYPSYRLVVLGHSLGGAFALLSGIEFQLMELDPLVVTYASPKIGNKAMLKFADNLFSTNEVLLTALNDHRFDKGYIRVVHEGDIVPLLPPTNLFRHGGVEYYIDKSELPHGPRDLQRKGNCVEEWNIPQDETAFTVEGLPEMNLAQTIPSDFGKEAHSSYFIKITGCN